ncbi:hypothetical protein F2Q68_00016345 [Brassica cretica]|uniref:Uncharacterized protein n=1 Tax=Brassica cretica TaxID=69181 RepID=A0A8S9HCX7_BRACR|nr:hypothetical protein F2Q68_00016345 [Brassica cretica]
MTECSGLDQCDLFRRGLRMDTRPKEKEKEKEKDMSPVERTPKDRTWTMVKERHREDSSHGKICGDWVIIDKCEVLIAYCANCELMID